MALIRHYRRLANGEYDEKLSYADSPAKFVLDNVPDGVPFRCYVGGVDISQDVEAMLKDGEFNIIEGAGKAVLDPFSSFNDPLGINRKIRDELIPIPEGPNQQAQSANNSLTNRVNKANPYGRVWDICGTVQSIPSDLMQSYNIYEDAGHKQYQYGYYYVARGEVDTPESGVLDGDTLYNTIAGSSAAFYKPFTTPNGGTPYLLIGDAITEPLFITNRSNSVDGIELKAPNEFELQLIDATVTCQLVGSVGSLVEATGTMKFDDLFTVGMSVRLANVKSGTAVLDGTYTVSAVSSTGISFDVSANLVQWSKIAGGSAAMTANSNATIEPADIAEAGFSEWVTISSIKPSRLVANIVARQGMYKIKSGKTALNSASVTAQLQWQFLDENLTPYGSIYTVNKTLTDKTRDEVGISIIAEMGTQSAVRARVRRSTDLDKDYDGQVADAVTYADLYGQIPDYSASYGDMTTVHTKRKSTAQATAIKQPQLKVLSTEMLYKYLGGGVFDTVKTPNTQAVQSLTRLMNDPLIGGVTMSNDSMDKLLEVQADIESYFGSEFAGQFCYTFDDPKTTAQQHCQIIAKAIFCEVYRENGTEIRLKFDKPVSGPAMVFTHRSKIGDEKWTRNFGSKEFDSVEFTYIDPDTNIKETIKIPEIGGQKPNKIDSKGVRNYQQAYWLAHRQRQRDLLQRITCEFTATEEGIFVVAGEPISVVKGSRIASYDGYIVAQNGLTLTLSQEVAFTDGDDHYIQLKRRNGTVESIRVLAGANARTVIMQSAPSEAIYTGNSALKTEFSFGNEARHLAQMIVPTTIVPNDDKSVKITGSNYHPDFYLYDGGTLGGAYSSGYSDGYSI